MAVHKIPLNSKRVRVLSLGDTFPTWKTARTIEYMCDNHVEYVRWALRNDVVMLDEGASNYFIRLYYLQRGFTLNNRQIIREYISAGLLFAE